MSASTGTLFSPSSTVSSPTSAATPAMRSTACRAGVDSDGMSRRRRAHRPVRRATSRATGTVCALPHRARSHELLHPHHGLPCHREHALGHRSHVSRSAKALRPSAPSTMTSYFPVFAQSTISCAMWPMRISASCFTPPRSSNLHAGFSSLSLSSRSDAGRGARMVAGDHHYADAGALGLADRHRDLCARRINDPDRASSPSWPLAVSLPCVIEADSCAVASSAFTAMPMPTRWQFDSSTPGAPLVTCMSWLPCA